MEILMGRGGDKTKPIQSQSPAFGRKSDNSGCVAGRLLPRVGRDTRRMGRKFPVCCVLISSVLPSFALIFIKENI
jgi:hypothetical protein